jgi:hypothetical protein
MHIAWWVNNPRVGFKRSQQLMLLVRLPHRAERLRSIALQQMEHPLVV